MMQIQPLSTVSLLQPVTCLQVPSPVFPLIFQAVYPENTDCLKAGKCTCLSPQQ